MELEFEKLRRPRELKAMLGGGSLVKDILGMRGRTDPGRRMGGVQPARADAESDVRPGLQAENVGVGVGRRVGAALGFAAEAVPDPLPVRLEFLRPVRAKGDDALARGKNQRVELPKVQRCEVIREVAETVTGEIEIGHGGTLVQGGDRRRGGRGSREGSENLWVAREEGGGIHA